MLMGSDLVLYGHNALLISGDEQDIYVLPFPVYREGIKIHKQESL